MKHRRMFLRWSLLPSLTLVGTLIVANLGWFAAMHQGDRTKLTYLILIVFGIGTFLAGKLAWKVSKLQEGETGERIDAIKDSAKHGEFLEGICEKLGLLGTLFGIVMMLSGGFGDIGAGGEVAQKALAQLTSGMSTAFITTLVGYICSILLTVQFHFIEHALGRFER